MKNKVNKFREFEKIYEQEEIQQDAPLRGYSADIVIQRIEQLMEIMPDSTKFGVPADTKGHATSYRDANGAIEKIRDVQHYFSGKGEEVKFYCWNISYAGSWDATKSLREKIDKTGGFGRENNLNLKKVVKYFSGNPEDVDNVRSFSISIDAKSIRRSIERAEKKQTEPIEPQKSAENAPGAEPRGETPIQ